MHETGVSLGTKAPRGRITAFTGLLAPPNCGCWVIVAFMARSPSKRRAVAASTAGGASSLKSLPRPRIRLATRGGLGFPALAVAWPTSESQPCAVHDQDVS